MFFNQNVIRESKTKESNNRELCWKEVYSCLPSGERDSSERRRREKTFLKSRRLGRWNARQIDFKCFFCLTLSLHREVLCEGVFSLLRHVRLQETKALPTFTSAISSVISPLSRRVVSRTFQHNVEHNEPCNQENRSLLKFAKSFAELLKLSWVFYFFN